MIETTKTHNTMYKNMTNTADALRKAEQTYKLSVAALKVVDAYNVWVDAYKTSLETSATKDLYSALAADDVEVKAEKAMKRAIVAFLKLSGVNAPTKGYTYEFINAFNDEVSNINYQWALNY